ncbi:MAG TPA: hypothetical protein VF384_14100 [Planctomycetota bacterium]
MKWLHVTAAFAASSCLLAQTPTAPQKPVIAPTKVVEERAASMREHMDTGKPLQSHVRVAVRLKNDNTLRGVVKDGKLVERVDGLRFVDAQAKEPGAGIRLWYATGARNYVFVPFSQFSEYEVLQRLSQKDLEDMERELQRDEASRGQAPAAPPPSAPPGASPVEQGKDPLKNPLGKDEKDPKGAKDKDGASKDAELDAEAEQRRLWFTLVTAYPPSAGWGAAKRDEISRRFVVIGAKPSEAEQRFVDKYADWLKACAHFGVDTSPKPAETPESGPAEPTSRRSRTR